MTGEDWQSDVEQTASDLQRQLADAHRRIAEFERRVAAQSEPMPLFYGRWHHGEGNLCCGTMRYMRADFDTQPAAEVRRQIFDWICETMNASLDRWRAQERARAEMLED